MLICGHCGGLVKSLSDLAVHLHCEEKPQELVIVENTDVQQLKAEIAALVIEIEDAIPKDKAINLLCVVLNKLRQLSAV